MSTCGLPRKRCNDWCDFFPNQVLAAGLFSGGCIAATLHPLFVVKTHQQVICEETEGLVLC